jgi:hypothetical protein
MGLLAAMARNKLASQSRRQGAQRRGGRRAAPSARDQEQFAAQGAGLSDVVAARDLFQEVRRRLSAEERQVLELRTEGHHWAAIAARLGSGAEALRKKHARALDRVAEQLGLDDEP